MSSNSGGYSVDGSCVANINTTSSKYKAYVQAVDRALKTFENPNEWADLIAALGKLTKVFQNHARLGDIPKHITVAKRLSQCLHPALPMGVHLKALETYRQVFDILGNNELPRHLYLFAIGLFPLMDHCGIKVKSELFNIFEIYLLPLGENLRPALPGFLTGVLIGLEEGTEFYERSLVLLERICEAVGNRSFFACLWQAVLHRSQVRLAAMVYVNSKLDKAKELNEQSHIVGDDVNHMVAALCAIADDNGSPLVQRHLLDFLYAAFPFNSNFLSRQHYIQLLQHALFVVLRRDMSLNRRLFTWILNPSGESPLSAVALADDAEECVRFRENVLPLICAALEDYLLVGVLDAGSPCSNNWAFGWTDKKESEQQYSEVRVCRLLLYLQDRPDVGKSILNAVLPVLLARAASLFVVAIEKHTSIVLEEGTLELEHLFGIDRITRPSATSHEARTEDNDNQLARRCEELSKNVNMLLTSGPLENGFIWTFLGSWLERLESECSNNHAKELNQFTAVLRACIVLCNKDSKSDVRACFLPTLLRTILRGVNSMTTWAHPHCLFELLCDADLLLCEITRAPVDSQEISSDSPPMSPSKASRESKALMEDCAKECRLVISNICRLYVKERNAENRALLSVISSFLLHISEFAFSCDENTHESVKNMDDDYLQSFISVLNLDSWSDEIRGHDCVDMGVRLQVLNVLMTLYTRSMTAFDQLQMCEERNRQSGHDIIEEKKSTVVLLKPFLSRSELSTLDKSQLFEKCSMSLWLGASTDEFMEHHIELCRLIVRLHSRCASEPSSSVEQVIVDALTNSDLSVSTRAVDTFHCVWTLTRHDDSLSTGKPFNRVVMLLLGVLADESLSRARSELKSAATAWFIDCANHMDLARIVQMLATVLLNPATARISIQYMRQESKLGHEQVTSLPNDVNVAVLCSADGKQRLYHVDNAHSAEKWLNDIRSRLLMSTDEHVSDKATVPYTNDTANFDEDEESLDTLSLSMESYDADVVDTVQFLVDAVVCEEEENCRVERMFADKLENCDAQGTSVTDVTDDACTSSSKERTNSVARIKKGHRRQDSLQDSIFNAVEKVLEGTDSCRNELSESLFHELHVHMLVYSEGGRMVDLLRAESVFRILKSLLTPHTSPISSRLLLSCLVSCSTTSNDACSSTASLVDLMAKHVRVILGQQFWNASEEDNSKHRHLTLLELLITISFHFLRSFYLNSPICPVSEADLIVSWKCKIAALDFLTILLGELSKLVLEQQSLSLVTYVQSVLSRAKLQRCLVLLLLSCVRDSRSADQPRLSESVSDFNRGRLFAGRVEGVVGAYERALLALTAHVVRLESEIKNGLQQYTDRQACDVMSPRLSLNLQLCNNSSGQRTVTRESHAALVELRAFLVVVLNALKSKPHRHALWLELVVHILPWMERSLATLVVRVVEQVCKNIEVALSLGYHAYTCDIAGETTMDKKELPPNYIATMLEMLTLLVHYCVVDMCATSSNELTTGSATVAQSMSVVPGARGATELFSNLVRVFSFGDSSSSVTTAQKLDAARLGWRQARNDMLTSLPRLLCSLCDVWSMVRDSNRPQLPIGPPQELRRLIIHLLSPVAQHYQQAFFTALSLVWLTRSSLGVKERKGEPDEPVFAYSPQQVDIANLLLSLKVVRFDDVVSTLNDTLKESAAKASKVGAPSEKSTLANECPLLELTHACIALLPPAQLRASWSALHSLFSEAPLSTLSPRAVFILFMILCDFVKSVGVILVMEDKAISRNMMESAQRLSEGVNAIVAWQLETSTWLKRTLVVRSDAVSKADTSTEGTPATTPSHNSSTSMLPTAEMTTRASVTNLSRPSCDSNASILSSLDKKSSSNLRNSLKDSNNNKRDPIHSTQALFLLSQHLADLVDSVCRSDDKEKLLTTFQSVWNNAAPFLRAKSARNARFFLAASQLLASMSSFSYTRSVWRKTTLELLLDPSFFKMDVASLRQWLIVADHLMTHDKTSFKDLLKSITYASNASFSIITSKEQELEARALALKRLAFVVLGSELDQYQAQMNDIQERLSENLRASQASVVRSSALLCIRVLLLRLRPQSLVGIWPIMITELVQVLLQLEQDLSSENEAVRDDSLMQLYLAACKMLESLCTLPAGYMCHFQMCHWAFVSCVSSSATESFVPFAKRIHKLLKKKYGKLSKEHVSKNSASLCLKKMLTSFDELRPFFRALASIDRSPNVEVALDANHLNGSLTYKEAINRLQLALYVDFAEHWQL